MFEVDGVKYVPISPSERICDIIDCTYDDSIKNVCITSAVIYKGIDFTVKKVLPYAFYGNKSLECVELDLNGVIGDYAFSKCSALESVELDLNGPIGDYAFSNCSALEDVQIGTGISSLKKGVFDGCSSLSSIFIPKNVYAIEESAFSNCSSLTQVTLEEADAQTNSPTVTQFSDWTPPNQNTGKETYQEYTFPVVPGDIFSFHCITTGGAWGNFQINIEGCDYTRLYEKNEWLFLEAGNVTVYFSYYNKNKSGQASFTNVQLDSSHTLFKMDSSSFKFCPLDSVYIGRNILYDTNSWYGYSPFYHNTSLRSVTITDAETEILANEFYGCTNLKNVKIGNSVTSIGDWAFSGCSSLDNFEFGSSVKSIGKEAFSDCTAMTKLISHAVIPPTCDVQALDDINKWTCTLSVPTGYATAYQQADQWKEFFFINDDVEVTSIENIINDSAENVVVYTLGGIKRIMKKMELNSLPRGIYIINGKKVMVK